MHPSLFDFLQEKANLYNRPEFIADDPIAVPHAFTQKQDIEIAGLFAAVIAWGQRKTILQNAARLMAMMDNAPHDFIINHAPTDLERFLDFVHRTFQPTDLLYFIAFLQQYYRTHESLETAFARHLRPGDPTIEKALRGFHDDFFALPYAPERTRKHLATPQRGSTCKRLCMYLRWMVRRDNHGVDFGLWQHISPAQLVMPLDVHVERQARRLGLLERKQIDWKAALELTEALRALDPEDPVRFDFALFGMGVY